MSSCHEEGDRTALRAVLSPTVKHRGLDDGIQLSIPPTPSSSPFFFDDIPKQWETNTIAEAGGSGAIGPEATPAAAAAEATP
eukprot:gene18507-biopygen5460